MAFAADTTAGHLEGFEVDFILRASRFALHFDQVLEGCDAHGITFEIHDVGAAPQRGISGRAGWIREEVEISISRREREHLCASQSACVGRERHIVLDGAESRIECEQQGAKPFEVRGVGGVTDVEIACEARAGLEHDGNATDDHEIDPGT